VKPFVAEMMTQPRSPSIARPDVCFLGARWCGLSAGAERTMTTYAREWASHRDRFDRNQNLYVGDRSGTIFKIGRDQQVFVFATLEPSGSAYPPCVWTAGRLFVTGPTTSSFDGVHRIDPQGTVHSFSRLGAPQGLAFDSLGNLYVAASLSGRRGIVKITPEGAANLEVAGHGLVGLAFASRRADSGDHGRVHHLAWNIPGLPLLPE